MVVPRTWSGYGQLGHYRHERIGLVHSLQGAVLRRQALQDALYGVDVRREICIAHGANRLSSAPSWGNNESRVAVPFNIRSTSETCVLCLDTTTSLMSFSSTRSQLSTALQEFMLKLCISISRKVNSEAGESVSSPAAPALFPLLVT